MEMDLILAAPNTAATSSMFSFDQVDEFFQLSPLELLRQEEDITLSSLLQGGTVGFGGSDPVIFPSPRRRKQRSSSQRLTAPETDQNPNGAAAAACHKTDKKVIHRDIERLRRKEMASLYGSLRSHLPLEFLKGKRSISDQIHEALKYIRYLQNDIHALREKRDVLKRMTEPKSDQTNAGEPSEVICDSQDTVTINPCMEGLEIIVNTSWRQGILKSSVLQVLLRGGLDVISFNSAQVNERVIYSIQAEAEGQGAVNLAKLRQKLMNLRARDARMTPLIDS